MVFGWKGLKIRLIDPNLVLSVLSSGNYVIFSGYKQLTPVGKTGQLSVMATVTYYSDKYLKVAGSSVAVSIHCAFSICDGIASLGKYIGSLKGWAEELTLTQWVRVLSITQVTRVRFWVVAVPKYVMSIVFSYYNLTTWRGYEQSIIKNHIECFFFIFYWK